VSLINSYDRQMPDVLLATCADLPDGDEDAAELSAALTAHDVDARWVVWDDRRVEWADSLVVLRSTWDYTPRRDEYLAWVRSLPRVCNPADVVDWNSDKRYLHDLAESGVAVIPTAVIGPADGLAPQPVEFVVKPSVGAGSRGAGRFLPAQTDAALDHIAHLHAEGRTALVQPYLSDVDVTGETALIYFDGQFSHAITKGPMLPAGVVHQVHSYELFVEEKISPRIATAAELEVGAAAGAAVRARFGSDLLYMRVDLLPSDDGPLLGELELTEPSLFLGHADGAADRFATAVAKRVRQPR
jgi:glutathione synthase/RimK-type ligase-like ATP-grasp enzyme